MALLIAGIGFAGVTIGVASLVLVVSFMNGAEARLAGQIASVDGHVFVSGARHRLVHPFQLEQKLAEVDGVKAAVATLDRTGLINVAGRSQADDLQGLDPAKMSMLPLFQGTTAVVMGRPPGQPGTLALGSDLAGRLGVGIGDHAAIASVRYDGANVSVANYEFTVSGIFRTDVYAVDGRRVIMSADDLRSVLGMSSLATRINVVLDDLESQETTLEAIRNAIGNGYDIATLRNLNKALFGALDQERLAMTVVISIVTMIALSNIMSSMVMLARYKAREIAILRTMGMSRASVAKVFVGVGAAMGLAGEAAGLGVGLALKAAKGPLAELVRGQVAGPSAELDALLTLPLAITGAEIGWIVVIVASGVVLSTLYPALRAAGTDPATVLRYT